MIFFFDFTDEFFSFFFFFTFIFLSFWFYYFYSFVEGVILTLIKLHFIFIEQLSIFFESPSLLLFLPRAYNFFFYWFPDRYVFFDFYWSQNLEDEYFKSLLVQMVPFASFLEEVRTNNARDFSNLDKLFLDVLGMRNGERISFVINWKKSKLLLYEVIE